METSQSARLEKARAALAAVQTRVGTNIECWDAPVLPLAPALSDALPAGLHRGQVVAVQGSTSLVLVVVAEASRALVCGKDRAWLIRKLSSSSGSTSHWCNCTRG